MINKEQLAEDYGNSWMGSDIAWAAAQSGYLAGWDACKQNLQQAACYTALELLQQMVGERSLSNAFNSDYHLKQKNYSEIDALRFVIELIKERQANAV
jgi:hypothetical protein